MTQVQYDAAGRTAKIREKRPSCTNSTCDHRRHSYTDDANGLASFTDVRGVTVTYAYTKDNSLDYLLEPGSIKTDFAYDKAVSTRTGATPDQSYVRDNTGRLIAIREGTARRYVHPDALGSVGALTNESGSVTSPTATIPTAPRTKPPAPARSTTTSGRVCTR